MNDELQEIITHIFKFMGVSITEAESRAIYKLIQQYTDEQIVEFCKWVNLEMVENWDETLKEFKERNK